MKKLILVDGNSLMFRAYYATAYSNNLMQTSKGEYTNALFAFINMFSKIVENENSHILVAFDTKEPTFRHIKYDEYKAGRKEMPEELAEQIPLIHEYINLLGIKTYYKAGYEADDIIGIFAKEASANNIDVEIYSSDRDLLQLVDNNITVNLLKNGVSEIASYTPKTLFEEFELRHDQIIDLKALQGDTSENIPGVPGVGPKTATKLLKQYDTIENIYNHIDEITGKLKERLIEHKDLAILSKKLVTILVEGDLDITFDDLKREEINYDNLISFLQNYELHSIVKQLNMPTIDKNWEYQIINNEEDLNKLPNKNIAIHFEFSEENYHIANLWGVAIFDGKQSYFVNPSLIKTKTFITYLNSNYEKYVYDYKAIKVYLMWQDIYINNVTFDLLLAAYLIDSHYGKEEFKYIVSNFNYDDIEYDELIYGKGAKKGLPSDENIYMRHIVSKARAIYLLKEELINKLKEEDQLHLLNDLELPLANVLAKMEFRGLNVDFDELNKLKQDLEQRISLLVEQIQDLAGKKFNVASPKQLGEILFDELKLPYAVKNKTGYSTNADILKKLVNHHPIIPLILEFRELNKLYTTYILGIENVIHEDKKVHTIFKQALTTTGRLSSVEPNLQNIPIKTEEGRQIRKMFIPENNKYFLGADYSQIELRVLADVANVAELQEAFNNKRDIHSETARKIFNIENEIDSEQRRAAKAVNFGIIYGMGAWSLAEDLNIDPKEAQNFIDKYLLVFPEIKKYMEDIVEFAQKNGYVETLINRRRYIPELKSRVYMQREFGKRTALNAPIQGTAADIIKIAMIKLDQFIEENNYQSKLLLQVHDELILEVPKEELEIMEKKVPEIMKNAFKLKVELDTSCEIGKTWYEI